MDNNGNRTLRVKEQRTRERDVTMSPGSETCGGQKGMGEGAVKQDQALHGFLC